ncbi:hypothetical protein [Aeromonas salmonicida]|nr:hypothetical protein [Aeromonas salmonicida]
MSCWVFNKQAYANRAVGKLPLTIRPDFDMVLPGIQQYLMP